VGVGLDNPLDLLGLFQRVGDITTNVSGGTLVMGVNFDTLAEDPGFGDWPSTTNALIAMPFLFNISQPLGTIGFDFDFAMQPTVILAQPYRIESAQAVPTIQLGNIDEESGIVEVIYSHVNGFYPIVAEFRYDDEGEEGVVRGFSASLDFSAASFYFGLPEGITTGRFVFSSDSLYFPTILFPPDTSSELEQTVKLNNDFFNVYPNPNTANELAISFKAPVNSETRIAIFNVRGQRIREFTHSGHELDLRFSNLNLESGIYFIKASNAEMSQVRRMTIIK
jgi:hypothetical protein